MVDAYEWSRLEALYRELQTTRPELRQYDGGLAVLASSDLAAFSFPSGRIYFSRGLCERLVNDDQRLAVLAHESAHILMRDGVGPQSFGAKQNLQREIRADRMAADMLTELGRSPTALVDVLQLTRSAHPKGCCEARLAVLEANRYSPPGFTAENAEDAE